MLKVNGGNSSLSRFLEDSSLIQNPDQTLVNLKNGSKGPDENMIAAKESFLLKEYFRRKAKEAEKAKTDSVK
jgi:phospholipid/cholesterol/gamma-HCH transport system substrate-binding protein